MPITGMKEATEGALGVPVVEAAGLLHQWDYQPKSVINTISNHWHPISRYLSTAGDSREV